jgi:type IV pilus assembly protein PilC
MSLLTKKDTAEPAAPKAVKTPKPEKEKKLSKKEAQQKVVLDANGVPIKEGPKFVWGAGKKSKPETTARAIRSLVMVMRVGESEARALEIVGEQFKKYTIGRAFIKAADAMRTDGAPFKQAILHENDIFPRTVKELIQAAPTSNAMQTNLEKAAKLVANGQDVKKKLIISMIQPGIMLVMCIGFLFIATAFIIPGFSGIFTQLNAPEPTASVIVRNAAEVTKYVIGGLIVVILLLVAFWFIYGRRSDKVRQKLDTINLKIPVVGNIIQLAATSRLLDLLALNLQIGMTEPTALESAAKGCGNEAITEHCIRHAQAMREDGARLKDFVDHKMFPISARYMIRAAPSVKQEIDIMTELAPEYRSEADTQVDAFQKTVEPIMTYLVYGVAGLLIVAIVTPMYAMYPALMDFGDAASGTGADVPLPTAP